MTPRPVLITGFEPYGGHPANPSGDIARSMGGRSVAGIEVVGCILPVSLQRLQPAIKAVLSEVNPRCIISLGLAPGESHIRVERKGLNVAHFDTADNDGKQPENEVLDSDAPASLTATLPVEIITQAILDAGIPARESDEAGSFLCNACLYTFLQHATRQDKGPLCGFIHLPFTPDLAIQARNRNTVTASRAQSAPGGYASMDLRQQTEAVEISIAACLVHSGDA